MLSFLASQNPDGGWPYAHGGPSWTEPTVYALLALLAGGEAAGCVERAALWLRGLARRDGGWPPQPAVAESTWVSALVALLGPAILGLTPYRRLIAWILAQTGEDTGWLTRLQLLLLGNSQAARQAPGWPWFPGSSAWVIPTALSLLALRKASALAPSDALHHRLDSGAAFLLEHACGDGGWNYGCPRVYAYDAPSYPETTGVVLVALHGSRAPAIAGACRLARAQLQTCRTPEAQSWLRLGLLAHGRLPPDTPPVRPPRTVPDAALARIAAAAERGHNILLE